MRSLYPPDYSLSDIPKRSRDRKIWIGYYSADFRNHAVSHLAVEFLESHDENKFELIAFSYGPEANDAMHWRVSAAFDTFIDMRSLSDCDVARVSREPKIDIAIDLTGLTFGGRPGIFAYRAAPIQLSYLGYLGTMAADYYDYLIADKTIIPPTSQEYYAEKIAYLPNYHAGAFQKPVAEKVFTREELGLPPSGFVFCCFNNSFKITPASFDGWMRILKKVKGSVLLLYTSTVLALENLKREAVKRGVDPNRIIHGKFLPLPEHLSRLAIADLFLDTLPYNAGTTASDALWSGLPVLTYAGNSFASRMAGSVLKAMGLPELIAPSREEYEIRAIELASNPFKLAKIKKKMLEKRSAAPLFDSKLFVKHIEAAYSVMYERYHAALPLEHFEILP